MTTTFKLYGSDSNEAIEVGEYFSKFSKVFSTMDKTMNNEQFTSKNKNQSKNINTKQQNDNYNEQDDVVRFDNINFKTLTNIVKWIKHYKDDKKMKKEAAKFNDRFAGLNKIDLLSEGYELSDDYISNLKCSDISEWDSKFLDMPLSDAIFLYKAADFLEIEPLYNLCAKHFANMIKGKNVEQIRKQFEIKNDFTSEELTNVKLEYEFLEDF